MSVGAEGLRVIEVGDLGEVTGKLLADAGADVIRVEPPAGAPTRRVGPFPGDQPAPAGSLHWAHFNTSKRGVTLDLETADGRALWWRLAEGADAVIDAAGHGVLDALDAGWEEAARRRDGASLVWCSVTPFGRSGPWAGWASNDLVQIALGGPMMSTGYDDHELPPIRGGYDHSLWMSGAFGTVAVLAARAGLDAGLVAGPELVDLSIHEAVSCTTEGAFPNWEYQGRLVQRQTGRHSSPDPTPEWQFPSADGLHLNVIGGGMPRSERNFDELLDWMEQHDAVEDLREPQYREAIHSPQMPPSPERAHFSEVVARFIAKLDAEEAYRGAQGMHLPWAVVRRPEDNLDDPHWADRGAFAEIEVPGHPQPVRVPTAPYRFEGATRQVRRRAPLLGEHNHEVYAGELGLSPQELLQLAQIGVI
jgi:benzylsuccinate CoA-transferase BbsE subunit